VSSTPLGWSSTLPEQAGRTRWSQPLTVPRYLSIRAVNLLLGKVTDRRARGVVAAMFWGLLRVSEALDTIPAPTARDGSSGYAVFALTRQHRTRPRRLTSG